MLSVTIDTLEFLRSLAANNNREWFQDNKPWYESAYKQPAKQLCEAMESALSDLTGEAMKAKLFRINRDIRFSKDKTPYNTHLHISVAPQGAAKTAPVWCFGLQCDSLSVGAGSFGFDKALEAYRQMVVDKPAFAKLVHELQADGYRLHGEPELKRVPAGFDKEHPEAELLRRKSLSLWSDFDAAEDACADDLIDQCIQRWQPQLPFMQALNKVR